jgi:hypothetical protein
VHLTELIEANHDAGGPSHGFLFGGQFHTFLEHRDRPTAEKKLLAIALHARGRDYLKDVAMTAKEKTRLTQGVSQLLQSCRSLQDIRDALPDVVVALFSELTQLTRTRPEAWPFEGKPFQMHSYKQTADLLSFYVSNRLLY